MKTQSWLTLIVLVVIAVVVLQEKPKEISNVIESSKQTYSSVKKITETNETIKKTGQTPTAIENAITNVILNIIRTPDGRKFIDQLSEQTFKNDKGEIEKITDADMVLQYFVSQANIDNPFHTVGTQCGQAIKISYLLSEFKGDYILNSVGKQRNEVTYILGNSDLPYEMEIYSLGMKINDERITLIEPQNMKREFRNFPKLKKDVNSKVKVEYKLLDYVTEPQKGFNNLRVFEQRSDSDLKSKCGDRVTADVKVTDIDGKVLFYKKKLEIQIGGEEMPFIFYKSAENLSPGSSRVLIGEAKFLKNFAGKKTKFFKEEISDNKKIIIETDLISVNARKQ